MGCLCSKGSNINDYVTEFEEEKERERSKTSSVQVTAPFNREEITVESKPKIDSPRYSRSSESDTTTVPRENVVEKTRIIKRPENGHRRHSTTDAVVMPQKMSRIVSMPHGVRGELAAVGWPTWLTSVAAEAVRGWSPRSADSYEKLSKIGQGTYSSVYMARDLKTEKIVAMKKVRFANMDPESVRFMAKEICIIRRLDHPNVMRLEALVTSRVSGSLYLIFEYMDHDLAGLIASPKVKFTEPQIKCYMQQILRGLEHCHSRGVLHRDIKGANILVDSKGIIKIGDFGLATMVDPRNKQPLTSRVVTLWYRAPELLLGATEYGPAIDMWSVGCILAELFTSKPIMPGRTEVEQMHKIFKLCGSPTEEYWKKAKLPHATSFKSQPSYNRRVSDMFKDFPPSALALLDVLLSIDPEERGTASSALKSEFFTEKPLPCDPSNLTKYPPSKEFDIKIREEAKRQRGGSVKGGAIEHVSKKPSKENVIPEGKEQSNKWTSNKCNQNEDSGYGYRIEENYKNGISQSVSVIHPNAMEYNKMKDDTTYSVHSRELTRQDSQVRRSIVDTSDYHIKGVGRTLNNDSIGYASKRNRITFSGPLMPPGGNMEDMLKEHERQIQEVARKVRLEKDRTKKSIYGIE